MKFLNAYVSREGLKAEGKLKAHATVVVDGVGEVKIQMALSDEVCQRIEEEACAALRVRLGQTLKEEA
jgi:hypothetical protein